MAWLPLGCTTSHASFGAVPARGERRVQAAQAVGFDVVDVGMSVGPEIDGGGLGLPHAGGSMPGRFTSARYSLAEGHVLVGFGHHGGLAGDGVAHHAEAVPRADDEGEEPVEIAQRAFQRLASVAPCCIRQVR
jgi:hypothetical protein